MRNNFDLNIEDLNGNQRSILVSHRNLHTRWKPGEQKTLLSKEREDSWIHQE